MSDTHESARGVPAAGPAGEDDALARYWSRDPGEIAYALGATAAGLSAPAAAERLRRFGPNSLAPDRRSSAPRLFLRQFESPLVLILVFAAVVAAVVQDWTNAAIVLAIVLGSGLLSFFQEYRASEALRRLRERVQTKTIVLRDGGEIAVPSEAVVPGDVVVLRAGTLVPADGVLLEAKDLYVSQSALTGEAMPVIKRLEPCEPHASLPERTNCVFMGTSVRSGTARALVVHTGGATVYGAIAKRLRLRPPETEFERGVRRYGRMLTQIMIFLVLVVFAANVFLDKPRIDSLLFAVALAVGISPELLPAIISVTLSAGARGMAARGVIVKRLSAIENFGSMDVFCSDKTGTLTAGVIALDAALDANGQPSSRVLLLAYLNARLQTGLPNPLDEAVVAKGRAEGIDGAAFRKIDEIPYDFLRRRLTVVVQQEAGGDALLVTKGAVESVLDVCAGLAPEARAALERSFERWSAEGYRVLGLATKASEKRAAYGRDDETGMTFEGFLLFFDPPKEGVAATLATLAEKGVKLKIVTGDNRLVTRHLGLAVGFENPRVLTGAELDALHEEALVRLAPETDFFVEVDPNQKERIILALKKAGHIVGYLGDGINDASALHAADVGISVDGAVDVAKEAADFVLLEHDLDVLCRGIEQGRKTLANTLKYVSITTSANFGNMISMAAASFFLPFLPLLAKQILLNNFLSDFPSMSIARDRVDPEMVRSPPRWDIRSVRNFTVVFGAVSSAFDFLTFGTLLFLFRAEPDVFRTGWFFESLMTELLIVLVVRTRRPFYRSRPDGVLLWSTVAVMAATFAIPYLPFAAELGFVPLSAAELGVLTLITLLYAGASEIAKRLFYGRGNP